MPLKSAKQQRQRGRPRLDRQALKHTQRQVVLARLRKHHSTVQRKMDEERDRLSALEKLPIELIQQIFFHSLEVNLPRASVFIRQVLSTEATYNSLITFAYFDDDEANPVEAKHFLPADYRLLECEEKIRLQMGILSCLWCTRQRIESRMSALSRLAMVQAWHAERTQSILLDPDTNQNKPIVANERIRNISRLPELEDEVALQQHFLARTDTEDLGSSVEPKYLGRKFLPRIITWSSSLDDQGHLHKGIDRSVAVIATRYIPSWLLRSTTWTAEELSLLQLLRQGYTFVQTENRMDISAEAMMEGMANAVGARNINALKTLLEMHNALFKSGGWTFQSMVSTPFTPPSNHPLAVELFHIAVAQGDQATELLRLLLRAGIDVLPGDDEIVTAWAVHESQKGNTLASWLLKHMEGTTDYGLPRRAHLFVDGCVSWRVRARGSLPFPETSFSSELGYISGTTTIVPYGPNGTICGLLED